MLKNMSNKTNFIITAGKYKHLRNFELQIVSGDTPAFSVPVIDVPSRPMGISRGKVSGSTIEHEQITVRFIVDRELTSYIEVYKWMLRISNYRTGVNTAQLENEAPTAIQYHILDNVKKNIMLTFNLIHPIPTNLGSLEYSYDEEGDVAIYCTVTFDFKRAELELNGEIIVG